VIYCDRRDIVTDGCRLYTDISPAVASALTFRFILFIVYNLLLLWVVRCQQGPVDSCLISQLTAKKTDKPKCDTTVVLFHDIRLGLTLTDKRCGRHWNITSLTVVIFTVQWTAATSSRCVVACARNLSNRTC